MSTKVRDYLKEYIQICLDEFLGKSYSKDLPDDKQENISKYVAYKLHNRLRPIGAAPLPDDRDSEECEDLIRILEGETEKNKIRFILPEVKEYIEKIKEEDLEIGDDLLYKDKKKKKKKLLVA